MKTESVVITSVKIKLIEGLDNCVAIASIVLNGLMRINGIRIMRLQTGFKVAFPRDPVRGSGDYVLIIHPIEKGFSEYIEETLETEYLKVIDDNESIRLREDVKQIKILRDKARTEGRERLADSLGEAAERLEQETEVYLEP